jgi:hypothetical protein
VRAAEWSVPDAYPNGTVRQTFFERGPNHIKLFADGFLQNRKLGGIQTPTLEKTAQPKNPCKATSIIRFSGTPLAPRNVPARQAGSKSTFFKRPKFRKQKAEINKSNAEMLK